MCTTARMTSCKVVILAVVHKLECVQGNKNYFRLHLFNCLGSAFTYVVVALNSNAADVWCMILYIMQLRWKT